MEKPKSGRLGSHGGALVPTLAMPFLSDPRQELGRNVVGQKRGDAGAPTPPTAFRPRPHPGGPAASHALPSPAAQAVLAGPASLLPGSAPSAPVSSPSSQTPPPLPAAHVRFPVSRSRGRGAASAPGLRLPARPARFAGHGAPSSGSRTAGASQPTRLVSSRPGEGAVESGRGVEISRPIPLRPLRFSRP